MDPELQREIRELNGRLDDIEALIKRVLRRVDEAIKAAKDAESAARRH